MTPVRVGSFGGASAFPLEVARRTGRFAAGGLEVTLARAPDSSALRVGLAAGELDVAHLAPDNVVAWRDGASAGPALPIRAFVAGSNGPIALVASKARSIGDLRGGRLGVDAVGSGFVPILRRLLASADLGDEDVTLAAFGATRWRAEALATGSIDATMLTLPWSRLARDRGAHLLADHRAVAPDLLTSCGASTDAWLAREGGALALAYAAAVDAAVTWLRAPGSAAIAAPWLAEELGVVEPTASAVLAEMLDPSMGWPLRGRLTRGDLDAVVRLRDEVGRPAAMPGDAYLWLPDDQGSVS